MHLVGGVYVEWCFGSAFVGVGVVPVLGNVLILASKVNFSVRRIETRRGPRVVLVVTSRRHNSTLKYVKGPTIVSPGVSGLSRRKALFYGNCSSAPDDAPTHTKLLANVSP